MKYLFALLLMATSPILHAETYAILISVCPQWKDGGDPETTQAMRIACGNTISLVQDAFAHHLRISKDRQTVLLDGGATYRNVVDTLGGIKKRLRPKDRLLVYVNAHGGRLHGQYAGVDLEDEGLALWTETEPNLATAVDEKKFMLVKQFRDYLLEDILENDVLVIFDSCESGAAYNDFRYNPYGSDNLRVAAVFSAQADQMANFTHDLKYPLFSSKLVHALALSAYRDLGYAIELAASSVHRSQRARCAVPEQRKEWEKNGVDLHEICLQQPYVYDPESLLQDWLIQPDER